MTIHSALGERLSSFGFFPSNGGYRAEWSSPEVEHYLFLETFDKGRLLQGSFALRNSAAERFARDLVVRFGSALLQRLPDWTPKTYYMKFSLGALAGWEPRKSLALEDDGKRKFVDSVADAVGSHLLPLVRSVQSAGDLLNFLLRDVGAVRWSVTNGAIRAAECVHLSTRSRGLVPELEAQLLAHDAEIRLGLDTTSIDSRRFIHEAFAAALQAKRAADFH